MSRLHAPSETSSLAFFSCCTQRTRLQAFFLSHEAPTSSLPYANAMRDHVFSCLLVWNGSTPMHMYANLAKKKSFLLQTKAKGRIYKGKVKWDQMEKQSDIRQWDDLIPDALRVIFSNLSLQEVLTVIPNVCKSWRKAMTGRYCWQEIDIEEWSSRCQPNHFDRMLRMLITRSSGSVRKLCVSGLSRNMHPLDTAGKLSQHDKANIIAATTPRLKRL